MLFVPTASLAGDEDDPGGMGSTECTIPPAEEQEEVPSTDLVDWYLLWLVFQILP